MHDAEISLVCQQQPVQLRGVVFPETNPDTGVLRRKSRKHHGQKICAQILRHAKGDGSALHVLEFLHCELQTAVQAANSMQPV